MTEGFTDITPPISSILTYTPAMKIGSSIIVGGIGGNFIPGGGGGSSSSMNFYKCASVDTTNHAWTGYLASVDSSTGVWSFASTATSGLSYDRITPVVGSVYDEDCTFLVTKYRTGLPEDGLIFYLPLNEDPGETDATGVYALYFGSIGNIAYGEEVEGLTGTIMGSTAAITGPNFNSVLSNDSAQELTISCWTKNITSGNTYGGFGFNPKVGGSVSTFKPYTGCVFQADDSYGVTSGDERRVTATTTSVSGVHHVLLTYGSNTVKIYVDGVFKGSGAYYISNKLFGYESNYAPCILGHPGEGGSSFYKAFRIYNRVLDSSEIAALAAEFTPTATT